MQKELEQLIFLLNPWLSQSERWEQEIKKQVPAPFIERTFLKEAANKWKVPSQAHLIIGPRQVGKSSAVWKHLSAQSGRVLYLNCEESLIKEWCSSPTIFMKDLQELLDSIDTIFFEEAQHLPDAGLFLKGLIDQKIGKALIVTGSSSYHLHAKTRESLAGRATRTRVHPFSLYELVPQRAQQSEMAWKHQAKDVIEEQLRYGSYPAAWLAVDKEKILYDLIEAFVIRDASDLFRIKHIGAFRQLLKLISWQVGNLVNYSEWGNIAGIDYNTVKSYINLLEETGIVTTVEPYIGGKRAEITSSPIVYFNDVGLRNAFSRQFSALDERADRGALFQNWVFTELRKSVPDDALIRFWRSKSGSESDFVLQNGKLIIGVEVKCARLSRGKISRSSRSFIEAYAPKKFFVVNRGYEGSTRLAKTEVIHLRPESLLQITSILC